MADIFDKWDNEINGAELMHDVEEVEKNGGNGTYDEVPHGTYIVQIDKMEIKATKKTGDPMLSVWFKISDGDQKGRLIFMNQILVSGLGIHTANQLLTSLDTGIEAHFDGSYKHYSEMVADIYEKVNGHMEFELEYGQTKKGFNTFKITNIYDI